MMGYSEFKKMVAENFKNFLPETFKNAEVQTGTFYKTNQVLDGITASLPMEGASSPVIYIEDMYRAYIESGDVDKILEASAKVFEDRANKNIKDFMNFCTKDRIVFRLINTEQNRELLETIPHRTFMDLAIIYYAVKKKGSEKEVYKIRIHNGLAESLGLSEPQLFHLAFKNTRRIFKPIIRTINEIITEEMPSCEIPPHTVPKEEMYVISSEGRVCGAENMIYEDLLYETAKKVGTDLFIMPSSTNEVIAISAAGKDQKELAEMVFQINMDQVDIEERLSNQVYRYDKNLRRISIATNTVNQRLDRRIESR